ncbi:hypothetical protein KAI65_00170 [Candidatus Parcubacteria bacterium]|nr:hypothetical protein [Candidatus Parcubacteria bacterium]
MLKKSKKKYTKKSKKIFIIRIKSKYHNLNIFSKLIVLSLPLILIAYLCINFYQAVDYEAGYTIDFNKENFRNTKLPLYIDEDPASHKFMSTGIINNVHYAEMSGSPISFVWQPEEFPLNKTITVSALIKDEGDWEISLFCPNCPKNEQYDWQPFYYGKLNDYVLAAKSDDLYIYSLNNFDWEQATTTKEWLEKNVPQGTSVEILDDAYTKSKLVNQNIDFIEGSWTEINKTLRGKHEFYVYLKDKLDLEMVKKDFNSYDGADDVNIVLYDLNDNVIMKATIEDDGIDVKNDISEFDPPIKKRIEYDIKKQGVYKLAFEPIDKAGADWTIKYIKINTNKIIFTGNANLILDPGVLYTELVENKELKIYVWHGNAVQTIKFINEDTAVEMEITKSELGKWQFIELNPGAYEISFAGDQYIGNANFAINKKTYFEPFIYDLSKKKEQSIVLANYSFTKNKNWTDVAKNFTKNDIKKLEDLKKVKFLIRNKELNKKFKKEKNLYDNGFYPLAKFNEYKLWGQKDLESYSANVDNLIDWLKNLLPNGSGIVADESLAIERADFINNEEPEEFVQYDDPINELNFALRGSHEFYVYINNHFKAEIDKEDINAYAGKDEVEISLINSAGDIMCDKIMADDENESDDRNSPDSVQTYFNCPNIKKGVYILSLKGLSAGVGNIGNDFVIKQLKINTNKIIIKNRILNIEPVELYVNNKTDKEIDLYYWHKDKDQIIEILGNDAKNIELTKDDKGKNVEYLLINGYKKINMPKGDVVISNNNFAFKEENWFYPISISIETNLNANFALFKDAYAESLFIKNINIDVQ